LLSLADRNNNHYLGENNLSEISLNKGPPMTKTAAEARQSLMAMFLCFPSGADDKFELRAQAYFAALSDLTPDEICAVCARASRAEIGNPAFLPSAAELHAAARPVAVKRVKPSPNWRPHQDRFLTSSGMLFVTEGGKTEVYTPEELRDHGYALPAPPVVLNRAELEARGVAVLGRERIGQPEVGDSSITKAITNSVKAFP